MLFFTIITLLCGLALYSCLANKREKVMYYIEEAINLELI